MKEEGKSALAREALRLTLGELKDRFPALGEALAFPEWKERAGRHGTDGVCLYWEPERALAQFGRDPEGLRRAYLHLIYHGLYQHPFRRAAAGRRLWNAACDLMTEYRIDRLYLDHFGGAVPDARSRIYRQLRECGGLFSGRRLLDWLAARPEEELEELERLFGGDSHDCWFSVEEENGGAPGREQIPDAADMVRRTEAVHRWRVLFEQLPDREAQHRRQAGGSAGTGDVSIVLEKERAHDFRQFLKRFAVEREEMCLDMDSFDYIPYDYSRRMYERLVFLEPLEYKDMRKLQEFVIAIDTSGSCSGEIVRSFLEETWGILNEKENFFEEMEIHILQCDCLIQEHVRITCEEEWKDYLEHIQVKGHGDTDFTPVFRLVDRLVEEGDLRDLKGLLYFTDGDGVYPSEAPAYDTAFVFLNEELRKGKAPAWAHTLTLDREVERWE